MNANGGTWPADNSAAGLGSATTINGKYVASITVADGGITVQYGREANSKLTTPAKSIGLSPFASPNGDVIWKCGNAADPSGTVAAGTPGTTDLENKYMPSSCRPN